MGQTWIERWRSCFPAGAAAHAHLRGADSAAHDRNHAQPRRVSGGDPAWWDYARRLTGSTQPFITEPLWTFSADLFIRTVDQLIAASKGSQLGLDFLAEYMRPVNHGIQFDAAGRAHRWRPAEGILIAGNIAFGAPCLEGTRIQTEVLSEMHRVGDSADRLAALFGITPAAIEQALAWEATLARAA